MRIAIACSLLLGGLVVADVPARGEAEASPAEIPPIHLEVKTWEGTFGTYMQPDAGDRVVLDLSKVGEAGLLAYVPADGPGDAFVLDHLRLERDEREGDEAKGWRRRIVLKGKRSARDTEKTVLEVVLQRVVASSEVRDGRTVALTGNESHVSLRLHTLRDDETIREHARAIAYHDLDSGFRSPAR